MPQPTTPRPFFNGFTQQTQQQHRSGQTPVPTPPGTPPAGTGPAVPAPPAAGTPPEGGVPAGSPQQVLADLASERDRRQAAERELATLREQDATRTAEATRAAQAAESAETARVRLELEARAAAEQGRAATAIAHLVRSEARRLAVASGVHDDRSETFLRLVDLTGVQLDAAGAPDATAIRTAVEKGLTDAPEFRAQGGPRRAPQYLPGTPPQGAAPGYQVPLQTQVSDVLRQMQNAVGITPTA